LQKVFNFIPKSIGNKIKYSNISRDEGARELRYAIELLSKARIINPVYHYHCSGLPLQAEIDEFTYKALFLDIGLMNRICGLDWLAISSLDDHRLINEGAIAEQFIGQHLLYYRGLNDPPELCYWLRQQKSANAECLRDPFGGHGSPLGQQPQQVPALEVYDAHFLKCRQNS